MASSAHIQAIRGHRRVATTLMYGNTTEDELRVGPCAAESSIRWLGLPAVCISENAPA